MGASNIGVKRFGLHFGDQTFWTSLREGLIFKHSADILHDISFKNIIAIQNFLLLSLSLAINIFNNSLTASLSRI